MGIEYAAVPQSEGRSARAVGYALDAEGANDTFTTNSNKNSTRTRRISCYELVKRTLVLVSLTMFGLVMGFCVGRKHPEMAMGGGGSGPSEHSDGLLPPSAFVPEGEFPPCCPSGWGEKIWVVVCWLFVWPGN